MSRKPYHSRQSADWFMKNSYFSRYMLRELTCIPIGLYTINLMAGLVAFAQDQGAWVDWLVSQRNPIMLLLMVLALFSSVFHTITWFETTPKIMKIIKKDGTLLPGRWVLAANWLAFAVLSLLIIAFAAFYS